MQPRAPRTAVRSHVFSMASQTEDLTFLPITTWPLFSACFFYFLSPSPSSPLSRSYFYLSWRYSELLTVRFPSRKDLAVKWPGWLTGNATVMRNLSSAYRPPPLSPYRYANSSFSLSPRSCLASLWKQLHLAGWTPFCCHKLFGGKNN